jgi:hypothetical protein
MVEQRTENPRVPSSILGLGTIPGISIGLYHLLLLSICLINVLYAYLANNPISHIANPIINIKTPIMSESKLKSLSSNGVNKNSMTPAIMMMNTDT